MIESDEPRKSKVSTFVGFLIFILFLAGIILTVKYLGEHYIERKITRELPPEALNMTKPFNEEDFTLSYVCLFGSTEDEECYFYGIGYAKLDKLR